MKKTLFAVVLTGAFLILAGQGIAQEQKDPQAQLKALVDKVQAQLNAGKTNESELAPYLKEFDALLEQHQAEKTQAVAQILMMKAMLYVQVLDDYTKGLTLIQQLKKDYPETELGKNADQIIASIERQQAAKKMQSSLKVGSPFPDFNEKDLAGKSLSIANYKGKVVLVDFWATWCGPCVQELPNVLKAYEQYHAQGFEIIGISLDDNEAALKKFIKDKGVTWAQYFDGKRWQNKLAGQYGINSIPATYLLDSEGKIAAKDLRGEALKTEVGKLLTKPAGGTTSK
jgi:peroxiredoxin